MLLSIICICIFLNNLEGKVIYETGGDIFFPNVTVNLQFVSDTREAQWSCLRSKGNSKKMLPFYERKILFEKNSKVEILEIKSFNRSTIEITIPNITYLDGGVIWCLDGVGGGSSQNIGVASPNISVRRIKGKSDDFMDLLRIELIYSGHSETYRIMNKTSREIISDEFLIISDPISIERHIYMKMYKKPYKDYDLCLDANYNRKYYTLSKFKSLKQSKGNSYVKCIFKVNGTELADVKCNKIIK